ncbi:unnamed protein product (macronuclear) [Paramecium tetraurelia]|uniref:MORN repeat protein n=1 Tax=Paramecium tetraurelia TaxID=5888 RepID=A0EI58_PARTE|nr:uncharacterized protein GSPATT00027327001 [Paramecium tetraurelia]CAK94999.1 unnamed protein product [Paramecium tetraurelia]|eukprot:XP_001462372.1 hypothetical protein (macronuclear) [Paramecium tetraurelia strain d4-2]
MNQQIPSEYFIQKFASLHLSETDDDTSRSQSPLLDSRLKELLKNFKPSSNFQLSKQNDESIYFGLMEGSLKHGEGIQLWPKIGNLLKGTWQNDLLEGVCTMFYANGDVFEAYFSQGTTIGYGMFKSEKKVVKGIWINNQLQGEGQELRSDGTTYQGQFWAGRKEGRGIQMFADRCKYEGFFQNNKFEGDGIFTWSDGSYYSGQFHKGLIRGFGNYNNNNGLQLIGQFQEMKKTDITDQNLKKKNLQTITFLNQYNQTLLIEKIRIL